MRLLENLGRRCPGLVITREKGIRETNLSKRLGRRMSLPKLVEVFGALSSEFRGSF